MSLRAIGLAAAALATAAAGAIASLGAARVEHALVAPAGFTVTTIAHLTEPRELAFAPNGDLLVGTEGDQVDIVTDAEGTPGAPRPFATIDDAPVAGVAFGPGALFLGGQFGVWRVTYRSGDAHASEPPRRIARVRTSGRSSDHDTTSVAYARGRLYASVGSSCNVCDPELDATRATIQEMDVQGRGIHAKAIRVRNAIALAVNPFSGAVWAGNAGQDELEHGHPYELFDPFTLRGGTRDYGWPYCYENRRPTEPGRDCSHVVVPRVVFPAYATPIGAAIYDGHGRYAFGNTYAGGAFVTLHGSWHVPPVPPRVVFVPLTADNPKKAVDWHDPSVQWSEFIGGFQLDSGERIGRPTGIAVGPDGSLFVADDAAGAIYRIRPRK